MEIHQKISVPNYLKLKTMVKKEYRSKTSFTKLDARYGRIELGALVKIERTQSTLKQEMTSVTRGKNRVSVRKEFVVVSAT